MLWKSLSAAQYCVERKYASYEISPVLIREFQDERAEQRDRLVRADSPLDREPEGWVRGHGKRLPGFLADPIQCPRRGSAIPCTRRTSSSTRRMSRSRSSSGLELRRPQSLRLGGNKIRACRVGTTLHTGISAQLPFGVRREPRPARFERLKTVLDERQLEREESRVEWSPLIAELPKPDREQPWDWPTLRSRLGMSRTRKDKNRSSGPASLAGGELLQYCLWYQGLSGAREKRMGRVSDNG